MYIPSIPAVASTSPVEITTGEVKTGSSSSSIARPRTPNRNALYTSTAWIGSKVSTVPVEADTTMETNPVRTQTIDQPTGERTVTDLDAAIARRIAYRNKRQTSRISAGATPGETQGSVPSRSAADPSLLR